MKYVRIPKERIGVLIGRNGETKQTIERISGIELEIDSDEGEVLINDQKTGETNIIMELQTENIIRAIGRGFSPEHAIRLFQEDVELFIFDVHDYVGKKEDHVKRLNSRIIGKNGKTRRVIEHLTGATLSIYGHTVGIIADIESLEVAKKAIDMLLSGSEHSIVYRYIEREMKKLKMGHLV